MGKREEIVKEFVVEKELVEAGKNKCSFKILIIGTEGSMAEVRNYFKYITVAFVTKKRYDNNFVGNPFPEVYYLLSESGRDRLGSATGSIMSD